MPTLPATTIPRNNSLQASPTPFAFARRLPSIDLLRGLVMVIMALDHTRDFFHSQALIGDPSNPSTTTPALFFTRFITHFCAPVFVFLAGTSAFLQLQRKSKGELSRFLLQRGLWLIVLEVVVMTFLLSFDPTYPAFFLLTIWAIGISMVGLGLLIHLPFGLLIGIGAVIVLGHNLLDVHEAGKTPFDHSALYRLMHRQGPILLPGGRVLLAGYPFLPWLGLMILGYGFGRMYSSMDPVRRRRTLTLVGLALILAFVLLRLINGYGDPRPWSEQSEGMRTFLSFLNVTKYPPSLFFLCITMGPALLFLAWFGEAKGRAARFITVFGKVPLFYYVLHFLVLHTAQLLWYLLQGHTLAAGWRQENVQKFSTPGEGLPLWGVYCVWIAVVLLLYPLCRSYARYKEIHRKWWLSYL